MPIFSCPNCQSKQRIPEGELPPKVTCPNCNLVFSRTQRKATDASASSSAIQTSTQAKPPAKPKNQDVPRIDDENEGPSRDRHRDEEDDEDDRPRSKRRDRDEDNADHDRPRSKHRDRDGDDDRPHSKRRNRHEDDDDDNRPRSKRRDRDEVDDEDDRPPSRRHNRGDEGRVPIETNAQYRNARTGISLVGIGFWCQASALGLVLAAVYLNLITERKLHELFLLAGLIGLANWVLSCIGFSFLVAGPKKGRRLGLSITLLVVSMIHLFFVIAMLREKNAPAFYSTGGSANWEFAPTLLTNVKLVFLFNGILGVLVIIIFVLAPELTRFILFALIVKNYGQVYKKSQISSAASMQVFWLLTVLGICFFLYFLLVVVVHKIAEGSSSGSVLLVILFLEYVAYIFVYVQTALLCGKVKKILYRKK